MIALAILVWGILGGCWRRAFGGAKDWARWTLKYPWLHFLWDFSDAADPCLRRNSFLLAAGTLLAAPLWLAFPWAWALAATGALSLFWAFGHHFTKPWKMLYRYGPVGLVWYAAQHWWPEGWKTSSDFIDGENAVAEFSAGFLVYGAVAAVLLM